MNEILLRRKNKVIVERGSEVNPNNQYIATIMKNVEALGYTFSKKLFETLQTLSRDDLQKFYLELVPVLKKLVGADVVYKPMYPNFPESVMETDYIDLFINATVHYWSYGTLYPNEKREERLPLFDATKVKIIDIGTIEDLYAIFNNLCQSKTSISQTDKEDLEWIFKNIQVTAFDNLVKIYKSFERQSFIAIDEINKFSKDTISKLKESQIIELDETHLLFNKNWKLDS